MTCPLQEANRNLSYFSLTRRCESERAPQSSYKSSLFFPYKGGEGRARSSNIQEFSLTKLGVDKETCTYISLTLPLQEELGERECSLNLLLSFVFVLYKTRSRERETFQSPLHLPSLCLPRGGVSEREALTYPLLLVPYKKMWKHKGEIREI